MLSWIHINLLWGPVAPIKQHVNKGLWPLLTKFIHSSCLGPLALNKYSYVGPAALHEVSYSGRSPL